MFRRRKKALAEDDSDLEVVDAEVDDADGEDEDDEAPAAPPVPVRPQGPWDVEDLPEDDAVDRVDLGGLRVPVPPDMEVRVDVDDAGQVVAATLVSGASTMQVSAFAAPKTSGIWDEVRTEIGEALGATGGGSSDVEGPYGVELFAAVPLEGGGATPVRFIGVDGPRWFVRAMLTGPAAQDRSISAPLEQALRSLVVVRGTEAMAVRDALPLRLPREVAEQAAAAARGEQVDAGQDAGPDEDALALPERGPEITEVR